MLRICTLLLLLVSVASGGLAQGITATHTDTGSVVEAATQTAPEVPAEPVVYNVADEMPAFTGGAPAFLKFLQAKLKYPEEALRRNISGKVHVSFVVDEEGRILDPKVVRGLGSGLDEEALRLVRIMPWWTPGRINGRPVRVAYTLPIVFRSLE
ncbi:MAG: energy transducer TonB [Hymenobacter sp.]|nr:energy transducer TonB [Hymenobacter sp.]